MQQTPYFRLNNNDSNLKKKNVDLTLKITTAGGRKAGITKLIKRIVRNEFIQEDIIKFPNAEFDGLLIDIENQSYKIAFWDQPRGAEAFKSLIPLYFRNSDCVILVYDVSDQNSFDQLQYHIQAITDILPYDTPKILVGQKIDQERIVNKEMAENLAKSLNAQYIETSAKTGENCQELINLAFLLAKDYKSPQVKKISFQNKSYCC